MQQARYEASLAERRYAACDPDNRLIAAQLEKNWEAALRRVQDLQARQLSQKRDYIEVDPSAFAEPGGQPVCGVECIGRHHARAAAACCGR